VPTTTKTRRPSTRRPSTRRPSAAELARAAEIVAAAQAANERDKKKRWSAEGIAGRAWEHLAHPAPDSLRALYRHVFTPWYWGAGVAGAVAVQEAAVAADGAGASSLALVAAGAALTANLAPRVLRTGWMKRRSPHAAAWAALEPGHTRVVANVAAAGAVLAHATGMAAGGHTPDTATGLAGAGLVAFLGCSARYWQHHRHHTRVLNAAARARLAGTPEPEGAAATPEQIVDRLHQRWPVYVASANGALPKSRLSAVTKTAYGATAVLHLVEGVQEKATVTASLGRIASGLKLSPVALAVEDIEPEGEEEPDSSIVRLRVVSQRTSSKPVPLDDGRPRLVRRGSKVFVRLGRYIDGDGEAEWLLYDENSAWGGFYAGKTGAGKTTLIETLVLGAFEHGATFVIYSRPKKGPSPRIAKHAHWTIAAEAKARSAMLDGIIRLMEIRGLVNELNETSNFCPSPEWPGVMVVIDEFHEFASQVEAIEAGRLNRIAREGRAVGVVLVGASQGFGLDGFAQDDMIRSNMTATNAVSMKLSATQAGIFKREMGLSVNPGDLPDPQKRTRNKGLAFSLSGRSIPFRGAWAPEEETDALMAAARSRAVPGLDIESAGALDEGSKGAYSRRHERMGRRKEEVRALLERFRERGQASAEGDAAHAEITAAAQAGLPVPPELPEQVVIDLAEARQRAGRSPAEAGVLEVLAEGPAGTTAIAKALAGRPGCGKDAVDRAIAKLAEREITKDGDNRKAPWKLVDIDAQ
jgi:hypothetical protein